MLQWFGLPLTLAGFRIPVVALGMASILLFFVICRRAFGPWPALAASALLAANALFFQMTHIMTVAAASGAALLFVVERLQALGRRHEDIKAWLGLSVAMALVSLHYGPGRIFSFMLLGLSLSGLAWSGWRAGGATALRRLARRFAIATVAFLALLALLDPRNLVAILKFRQFLFPTNAETMEYAASAAGDGGFARMVAVNLQILGEAILGQTGEYHTRFASYVGTDFRYPLLDLAVVPLMLGGLLVCLARLRRDGAAAAMPWRNTVVLFAVVSLPLLTSSVIFKDTGPHATLSDYRMYFCLFPLHLLVAAALSWLGEPGRAAWPRLAGAAAVVVSMGILVTGLVREEARFRAQVQAGAQPGAADSVWEDAAPNRDRRMYDFISHFKQHAQYLHAAGLVAQALASKERSPGVRRIVHVGLDRFTEAPLTPAGFHYITGRNYHAVFLALYAGELGVDLDPVIMVSESRKPIRPDLMGGLAYRGKPREYSALLAQIPGQAPAYADARGLVPAVARLSGRKQADILVTTPEEEAGARRLLESQGIRYDYLRL